MFFLVFDVVIFVVLTFSRFSNLARLFLFKAVQVTAQKKENVKIKLLLSLDFFEATLIKYSFHRLHLDFQV
jgi:hypothetical protein